MPSVQPIENPAGAGIRDAFWKERIAKGDRLFQEDEAEPAVGTVRIPAISQVDLPFQYLNGGVWTYIGGFYVCALIKRGSFNEAKKEICQIPGVGNKVADCILLFSLNKLESFPLDRWMIRILEKYYANKFYLETKTITEKQYEILHEKIINHFGPFAGYAQQFLFKMERENYQKKWL